MPGNKDPKNSKPRSASQCGESSTLEALLPHHYDELHKIALSHMRKENLGHTLQATALVHEAYLKIANHDPDSMSRTHVLALSAQAMRRILIDHARSKRREKRGGEYTRVTLSDWTTPVSEFEQDILELHDALEKLAQFDSRAASAVELMFFAGLSYQEIAESLGVGRSTVYEDIKAAKAWLAIELSDKN